jgi:hypothetical protein
LAPYLLTFSAKSCDILKLFAAGMDFSSVGSEKQQDAKRSRDR